MRFLLILFIGILGLETMSAQSKQVDIRDNYQKIFGVEMLEFGNQKFPKPTVKKLKKSDPLYMLTEKNKVILLNLFTDYSGFREFSQVKGIEDSISLQKDFYSFLNADAQFGDLMDKISEKINNGKFIDTVTIDQLTDVASKYFYIKGIDEQDRYEGKVCGGLNGNSANPSIKHPFIEAFSVAAILENFQKGSNLYDQFVRGMKNLNKIQFSENQEQRLLEARGAMYLFMFNNQEFRDTLISEYEKRKQVLPFYLKV